MVGRRLLPLWPLLRILSRARRAALWTELKPILRHRLLAGRYSRDRSAVGTLRDKGGSKTNPQPPALFLMATGYWLSQAVYVAAKLGLADLLTDGPRSCSALAEATGADGPTLFRLMRALSSAGVFAHLPGDYFALSCEGESLQSHVPGSLRAIVITIGEIHYQAWGHLLQAVRSGSPAFNKVFGCSPSTRPSFRIASESAKLTVLPRLQLFLQSDPLTISQTEDQTVVHEGEVFAGLQGVLFPGSDSRPTFSVSYIRRVHASVAPELDIGSFRQSGLFLVSDNVHGFHIDVNGIVAEQAQDSVRRAQFGQTLSISHPLRKLTISGEIWHFSQPFERGNTVGNLWAFSYPVRKNLVVDGGFNHGLTKTSTQWEFFSGFTYVLPHRLWGNHHGSHSP